MTKFNNTANWLTEQYVINDRPRKELAEECGLSEAGLKSLLIQLNIKKEKLTLDKKVIEDLINKGLDHKAIEDTLNIGQTTLYRYLKKYNLEIKTKRPSTYDDSNDLLYVQLYFDGFSSVEIAKEFKVSHRTVLNHLQHNGIVRRSLSKSHWAHNKKELPKEFDSYETMYDLYITKHMSKKELGIKFNCDPGVIHLVLESLDIPVRDNSESKIGLCCGESHWNWKGGITSLARRLREYFGVRQVIKVLERDKYTCQMCGSKEHLEVHHIKSFSSILKRIISEHPNLDPIKDVNELCQIACNDTEFNDLGNLITYCHKCHFYKVHKYENSQADFKPSELLED